MVNNTTLKELNRFGFGADIDSLESFILDYKQASLVSDLEDYKEEYLEAYRLLELLKPTSEAFGRYGEIKVEQNTYARLFYNHPVPRYHSKYGNNITKMYGYDMRVGDAFTEELKKSDEKEIVCVLYPRGLDIDCIYINGYLYKVYCVGYNASEEPMLYDDISEFVKGIVKSNIPKFKHNELAELRGKLVIDPAYRDMATSRRLEECTIAEWIRLGINKDKLSIVYTDIITDTMDIFEDQWAKLEYMSESLGLSCVANHYFVRNASEISLQALTKEMRLTAQEDKVGFEYSGIEFRVNADIFCDRTYSRILSLIGETDPDAVYTSIIKSYTFENRVSSIVPIVNFVSTNCGSGITVDKLEIDDVCNIEKYGLYPGNKISFRVVNGRTVLSGNSI